MEPMTTLAALTASAKLAEMGLDSYGAWQARKAEREAANARRAAIDEAMGIGQRAYDAQNASLEPTAQYYIGDLANWRQEMGREPVQMGQFDDSRYNVQAYLDPAMQFRQEAAQRALNAQAATTGGLYSGAQAKALQDRSQQIAADEYGAAFGRMQGEREFGYRGFMDRFRAAREAAQLKAQNLSQLMQSSGAARNAQIQNAWDLSQMQAQGAMQKAGITAQNIEQGGQFARQMYGNAGQALGGLAGTAGSYYTGGFDPAQTQQFGWDRSKFVQPAPQSGIPQGAAPQRGGAAGDTAGAVITTNSTPDYAMGFPDTYDQYMGQQHLLRRG